MDNDDPPISPSWTLVVHGGAGNIRRELLSSEKQTIYLDGLKSALLAGNRVLQDPDGTCVGAVEAAVRVLEDHPFFNAGRGAVYSQDGRILLDAAIMGRTESTRRCGNPGSACQKPDYSSTSSYGTQSAHLFGCTGCRKSGKGARLANCGPKLLSYRSSLAAARSGSERHSC